MKNKGFTLIELLAVIVILAIIALIATPIVLNIINNSRESSNERSVELYGKAVEQAIAKAQLTEEVSAGDLKSITLSNNKKLLETVQYSGSKVECETNTLYSDGKIYLAGCKVNGKGSYTYGEEQKQSPTVSVPKPTKYASIENLMDGVAEEEYSKNPANPFYVAYDDNGNTFICFVRNNKESCLTDGSGSYDEETATYFVEESPYYQTNKTLLGSIFDDCNETVYDVSGDINGEIPSKSYTCHDNDFEIVIQNDGSISANAPYYYNDDSVNCNFNIQYGELSAGCA